MTAWVWSGVLTVTVSNARAAPLPPPWTLRVAGAYSAVTGVRGLGPPRLLSDGSVVAAAVDPQALLWPAEGNAVAAELLVRGRGASLLPTSVRLSWFEGLQVASRLLLPGAAAAHASQHPPTPLPTNHALAQVSIGGARCIMRATRAAAGGPAPQVMQTTGRGTA